MIEVGTKATRGKLWDGHRFHHSADFGVLAPYTNFPVALLIPQHETERILSERLYEVGMMTRAPCKVVEIRVNEDDPNFTDVVFEEPGEVVKARYVVGADGARSIVCIVLYSLFDTGLTLRVVGGRLGNAQASDLWIQMTREVPVRC